MSIKRGYAGAAKYKCTMKGVPLKKHFQKYFVNSHRRYYSIGSPKTPQQLTLSRLYGILDHGYNASNVRLFSLP